ncbi:unnamed protein product [Paramecium sonneborni]|uniref:Uncharacterized protein n=1 Tax=Paramecium sonneborni TaxID=65129 RepID=A0A8S1LVY5_9CILI|nr:unnamed protein product [Paramecium sonneborni]
MGQSKLGPQNSDKSFSIIRFYQDKQYQFSEDINEEFLNNALNFSHWHFMIHESLIVNGYLFSNCKLTLNSSFNHNKSRIILQKENKILTFQHEFERVSNDFRFKQNSYIKNTTIEEVNIIELYRQLNQQNQENIILLDSFGTANSTIQPSFRGRQHNQIKKIQQSSDEEDFTDFEDKSHSSSPFVNRIQKNQISSKFNKLLPSDSDSGQDINKSNNTQKQSNYQESPLSITNQQNMEDDKQEQELVYQINSEIRNLKNKIEQNIGPSYKNLDVSEEYTTNYQKLIEKQRNQKAIYIQRNSQQQQQNYGNKKQSLNSTVLNYKIENQNQQQFNQLFSQEKVYQKPEQIKFISVKINSNLQLPQNSQKSKISTSKETQVPISSEKLLNSPRSFQQTSNLSHTTGSESNLNYNTLKQKNPQPQPINIKIDLKAMSKKPG